MCNTVLWQCMRCVICGESAVLFGVCLLARPDGFASILCGLSGWLAKFITDILWSSCDGFGRKMWGGPVCSALRFVFCSALRFVFCSAKFVRKICWCFCGFCALLSCAEMSYVVFTFSCVGWGRGV